MSFSSEAKDELTRMKLRSDGERRALLAALTHTAGSMSISRSRGVSVEYVTERHGVGRLVAHLAGTLYGVESALAVRESESLKSRSTVVTLTGKGSVDLLVEAGCLPAPGEPEDDFVIGSIPAELVAGDELMRCFLRGAFLGSGSVSSPKTGYHLEIVCSQERFAFELGEYINSFELNARVTRRKSSHVVYIKEGEKISDFLTLIGAMGSVMAFEHAMVLRNVANDLNRRSNFEDANMQKTAMASAQQLLDIELLAAVKGLESLPQRLREAAEARLNNPEAPLSELAKLLDIGKSGINHRLAKLSALADELRIHGNG